MSNRFLVIIGIVLVLFPFLAVYAMWKMWLAFGIGLVILTSVCLNALRDGKGKK